MLKKMKLIYQLVFLVVFGGHWSGRLLIAARPIPWAVIPHVALAPPESQCGSGELVPEVLV